MHPSYCIVYTNGSQLVLRLKHLLFSEFILEPMSQIVKWVDFQIKRYNSKGKVVEFNMYFFLYSELKTSI